MVPNPKKYPQKYAAVYMPISLAAGRVRTPEFPVKKQSQWYDIMLQFEKPLPFGRMVCMVGVTSGPIDKKDCDNDDPIVRADWTVWEDGRIVEWGSIPDNCGCIFTNGNILKQVGSFAIEAGKNYVVQVHFTRMVAARHRKPAHDRNPASGHVVKAHWKCCRLFGDC